jgi:hypothetical protein
MMATQPRLLCVLCLCTISAVAIYPIPTQSQNLRAFGEARDATRACAQHHA